MTRTQRILGTLAVALLLVALPACGGMRESAERQKTTNDIKQVLIGYHSFVAGNDNKAPASAAKFSAWATANDPDAAAAHLRVLAKGYKVYWGSEIDKLPSEASNTVLIYHADATTKGGMVGMADGSVKTMTAAEFNAEAKPTPPLPK